MAAIVYERERWLEELVRDAVETLARFIRPEAFKAAAEREKAKANYEAAEKAALIEGETPGFKRGTVEDLERVKKQTVVHTEQGPMIQPSAETQRALREMHEFAQREGLPRHVAGQQPSAPRQATRPLVIEATRPVPSSSGRRLVGAQRGGPESPSDLAPLPQGPRGPGGHVIDSFGSTMSRDAELLRRAEDALSQDGSNPSAGMIAGLLRRTRGS